MSKNIQISDIWSRCKQEARDKKGGYWANVIDLFRSYTRSNDVTEDNVVRYLIQQNVVTTNDLLSIQEEFATEAATLRTELQRGLGIGTAGDAPTSSVFNRTSGRGHPGVSGIPNVHVVRETADEIKISDGQTLYTFKITDHVVGKRFKEYMEYTPSKALDYLHRNAKLIKKEAVNRAGDLVDAILLGADIDGISENAGYIYHNDYAPKTTPPAKTKRKPTSAQIATPKKEAGPVPLPPSYAAGLIGRNAAGRCPKCNGVGKFHTPGTGARMTCPDCRGTGQSAQAGQSAPQGMMGRMASKLGFGRRERRQSLGTMLIEGAKRVIVRCKAHAKVPPGHPGIEQAVKEAGNYVIDTAQAHGGKVVRADVVPGGVYTIQIDMDETKVQQFLNDLPARYDSANGVVVEVIVA